jgi:LacI family transcriptional regulator/LacI family repressor for deo operon, udp, cdd, tsx, nupC, and nupG
MAAAEELRYAPNPAARALVRGRTGNLGIVVPDIANSFSASVTRAVQQEARRDGFALFVAASDDVAADEEQSARALAAQVDGLILVSPQMSDEALRTVADLVPVVVTNRILDGLPAVLTRTAPATGHAVEHLHSLGHRRLVYLAGPQGYANDDRLAGFRSACARLGLEGAVLGSFNARFTEGVRAADLVLAASATGVVAYNDEIAVGMLNRLTDRGIAVPRQISLVGFDDTGLAEMVTPRLTTVRVPAAATGVAAVDLLTSVMTGRDVGRRAPVELPGELIVRASTGTAPDSVDPRVPS